MYILALLLAACIHALSLTSSEATLNASSEHATPCLLCLHYPLECRSVDKKPHVMVTVPSRLDGFGATVGQLTRITTFTFSLGWEFAGVEGLESGGRMAHQTSISSGVEMLFGDRRDLVAELHVPRTDQVPAGKTLVHLNITDSDELLSFAATITSRDGARRRLSAKGARSDRASRSVEVPRHSGDVPAADVYVVHFGKGSFGTKGSEALFTPQFFEWLRAGSRPGVCRSLRRRCVFSTPHARDNYCLNTNAAPVAHGVVPWLPKTDEVFRFDYAAAPAARAAFDAAACSALPPPLSATLLAQHATAPAHRALAGTLIPNSRGIFHRIGHLRNVSVLVDHTKTHAKPYDAPSPATAASTSRATSRATSKATSKANDKRSADRGQEAKRDSAAGGKAQKATAKEAAGKGAHGRPIGDGDGASGGKNKAPRGEDGAKSKRPEPAPALSPLPPRADPLYPYTHPPLDAPPVDLTAQHQRLRTAQRPLVVAVHLRLGDAIDIETRTLPFWWYRFVFGEIKRLYPGGLSEIHVFTSLLSSEPLYTADVLRELLQVPGQAADAPPVRVHCTVEAPKHATSKPSPEASAAADAAEELTDAVLSDFAHFVAADVLVPAKSSFSRSAAIFNPHCVLYTHATPATTLPPWIFVPGPPTPLCKLPHRNATATSALTRDTIVAAALKVPAAASSGQTLFASHLLPLKRLLRAQLPLCIDQRVLFASPP
eukprot:gene5182-3701_t